jgi:hypothetical protein
MKDIVSDSSPFGDGSSKQARHRWQQLCHAEPELRTLEQAIRSSRPPAAPLGFFTAWRTWKRVLAAFAGPNAKVSDLRDPKADKFCRAWLWLVLDAAHPLGKRPSGRKCA